MADVVKQIDRALPPQQRYVVFSNTELSTGDVIRVFDSLGRPADSVTIECSSGSDLEVRVNSRVKIYPIRQYPSEHPYGWAETGEPVVADPREFNSGVGKIKVGSATSAISYQLNDVPVTDLEVTFTTGTFTIMFS